MTFVWEEVRLKTDDLSGPPVLRSGSAAVRLLGLWGSMSVSCECCVLSGRDLCVGLITRPEESYPVWCVLSVIVKSR